MNQTMNIFLIEDNDLDAEFLCRGLKEIETNGSLIRARDGIEALEMLTRDEGISPDLFPFLILLDINMPRMNGHEFLYTLRKTKEIAAAPVVVFTTSNNKKDISTAYQKNVSGYFVKPTSYADLKDVLATLQGYWNSCAYPDSFSIPQ